MHQLHQGRPQLWALLVIFLVMSACATSGDYGDAPDGGSTGYPAPFAQRGSFPTLAASGGAMTEDLRQATLGPSASAEADANDPADPDGQPNLNPSNTDADDGIVDFVVVLTSIPPPAGMTVNVVGPPGSRGGTYFVNALIDLNLDGRWGGLAGPGLPEWVVKNFPVQVAAGTTTQVALPPFFYGFGNRLPDGAWMRILLSNEPVTSGDWDGTGSFDAGEVEDHVITLPRIQPNKRIVIHMTCPRVVRFPRGAGQVQFNCRVDNVAVGATNGSFSYFMTAVNNIPSVQVQPMGQANRGCVPAGPPPGGPVNCGTPPGDIPIAGAGPVLLPFTAIQRGPLPSQWTYRARAEDPPAVIRPTGVTIGFGDSMGDVRFEEVDVLPDARLEITDGQVIIVLKAKDPAIREDIRVPIGPGERFGGVSYEQLLEQGAGPIRLPALP
ncbi:MAG: hypothetical protein D6690_11115 [Nitrospirae bacterium]|nr:MAG: hypothetical protein D6690_11115 [Nitrospirota bacterium]